MNKSYLFIGYDSSEEAEISEFITNKSSQAFFAATNDRAAQLLDQQSIDTAIIYMRSMNDAVILRYINKYYPEVQVVLSANKEFDEVISIFHQGTYSRLPRPFRLEELDA
jgi:DNA-binding NtrC family response regulator